ncbi:terpenoid cyclases/Protein prenyltransferase [Wolfiporia cocos MD-104 SS10]|uniref:Terpenoid cyclases/Protein prenyltransferase n=1 Tax=Wolfiporia cocos (strain MD-104) TaxID=742152 RepID=A0A2H3JGW0_WOLCO|nr:terpenoid cyclases/Protein prenyltransferase [Wolfiporia cocos MD-104 SS10]
MASSGVTRNLRSTPVDGYPTPTSALQSSTETILVKHLPIVTSADVPVGEGEASGQGPALNRQLHLQYLLRNLLQGFPARYASQDASQPWLIFWTLQAFSILGVGLDDRTKQRARESLLAMQHPNGGFGGGPGQAPHLLPTYASVCALAIVGHPGKGGAWEGIDRKKLYDFFMSLKQPDGSFLVAQYAEVDMRGLYCLLAVATLLNLMTPELLSGIPEFIASCQTFEGGFGNASFSEWAFQSDGSSVSYDPSAPRPVIGEAHGGYTFCAAASWVLLRPYLRLYYDPSSHAPKSLSASIIRRPPPTMKLLALLRWLSNMQGIETELGGFKGRTNKLVDGCYSWWVGGCFGLVEGLMGPASAAGTESEGKHELHADEDGWDDVDDALLNREALQEYILYAGQHPAGGLRDKPPKYVMCFDSRHRIPDMSGLLPSLATLSMVDHRVSPDEMRRDNLLRAWKSTVTEGEAIGAAPISEEQIRFETFQKEVFANALCWLEDEGSDKYVGGNVNRLNATQPLFNLTVTHSEQMMAHFYGQTISPRTARNPPKCNKSSPPDSLVAGAKSNITAARGLCCQSPDFIS